jgi:predicted MFS family arabinose efflux permease
MKAQADAAAEWRQFWYLPLVAALGYSTSVLSSYGLGPFVEPLQREFGWSRANISFGLTIVGLSGAVLSIPLGIMVDRFGPRRVALVGTVLLPAAFALLGTATGSLANWYALWAVIACSNFWIQGTVWVAAVGSRFDAARGLAMAITMSGGSLTSAALPLVATYVIETAGWRAACMAVGGLWFVVAFPPIFLFFRGARDDGQASGRGAHRTDQPAPAALSGLTVAEALRMRQFYQLLAASGFFAFGGIGLMVHFVPVLTDAGASPLGAAGVTSLVGIFSIIGRLSTGFLIDRYPARHVGALVFLLPVFTCLLLLTSGADPAGQIASAVCLGFTLGAEIDVIAYLAARHFGLKHYGALFGSMTTALALGTALGPLAAGAAFDIFGSYAAFLVLTAVLMAIGSLSLAALGEPAVQSRSASD